MIWLRYCFKGSEINPPLSFCLKEASLSNVMVEVVTVVELGSDLMFLNKHIKLSGCMKYLNVWMYYTFGFVYRGAWQCSPFNETILSPDC